MKKALSLILSIVFVLSAATVFAGAATTKTDALLSKLSSANEVSVKIRTGSTYAGASSATYIIKGNNAAYDYNTGFFNVRVVLTGGSAYAYLPVLPFFYVKVDNTGLANVDVWALVKSAVGITKGVTHFETSYEEELDGTRYYVEQFNDGATVKLKFYYLGDTLKILNVYDSQTKNVHNTYFDEISFSVSDSMVAVPGGLDLTPFLKNLLLAFIAGQAA